MNEEKIFYSGGFSPSWIENPERESFVTNSYKRKDLKTLLSELEEIKEHLQNVQEKLWIIATKFEMFKNGIARE